MSAAQWRVRHEIRSVFPVHYREAQRVAYCESRYHSDSVNGIYKGVYQLSDSWRLYFRRLTSWSDVAFTARENIQAAHRIYLGQGWRPWTCAWAAYSIWAPR